MEDAIVLYPAPGISHLAPMIELSKLILLRYPHRFSVTLLLATGLPGISTPTSYIDHISQTNPSISFLRFPPLSLDNSPSGFFDFFRLNAPNLLSSLRQISTTFTIRALIIDHFFASALPVARDLGIPTFHFLPTGAAATVTSLYFPTIHQQTQSSNQSFKDMPTAFLHFPGLPPLLATRMPAPLLSRDYPAYHEMLYLSEIMHKSDGILINTFDDFEPIAIQKIREGACVPDGRTPPVYCIGPLIANAGDGERAGHSCLSWLDKQPSESVVFLCFGSLQGALPLAQMKEIANGLESSGIRFLWVVKNPPSNLKGSEMEATTDIDLDVLMPDGFLERTKDRGMVVKTWAPQVEVLNHPSVGGFVTHCGWNSVMEAVVAGVPMVAWPLYAEQHVNKAVLVQDMKMAVGVEQRDEDLFVSGAEVERRVKQLMECEEGRELRERSKKMREMALAAWKEGGSSSTALARLADIWNQEN